MSPNGAKVTQFEFLKEEHLAQHCYWKSNNKLCEVKSFIIMSKTDEYMQI